MPSGVLSNLNVSFSCGFPRTVRVKQSQVQPFRLIESLPSRNISGLTFSSKMRNSNIMAASGSRITPAELLDPLVSRCCNLSGYVKPGGIFFGDSGHKICWKARVRMRSGESESALAFGFEERRNAFYSPLLSKGISNGRGFSSSCYFEIGGIVPEVSTYDGSLSAEHLSSLAIPVEEQRSPSYNTLTLVSGACYKPHPDKVKTGGEDAHFICANEQVIGVADGVGGWADVGVNAGIYARELMSNSVKAIRKMPNGDVDPLRVLKTAHAATCAMGSSTACIIVLKKKELHAINLGDSGFIIVRDGHTIFESPVQQHDFNFPYQLQRGSNGDQPSSGQVFKVSVAPGDVVVAGTDGLFDNLNSEEIATTVAKAVREGLNPEETAKIIANFARTRALDTKHESPFSAAAKKAGFAYYGGKLDDLTVVVSYVSVKSE